MDVESLSGIIWGYLTWLPKWFLRWKFSEERMADFMMIDILPRHSIIGLTA